MNATKIQTQIVITNLPSGSNITLEVRVKANHDVMGDAVSIIAYTGKFKAKKINSFSWFLGCDVTVWML